MYYKTVTIFKCPHCLHRNRFYDKFEVEQTKIIPEEITCHFCKLYFKLSSKTYLYQILGETGLISSLNKKETKMKRTKQDVGMGQYLTIDDIGDGNKGDKTSLVIKSDGELKEGSYGERLVIEVELKDKEIKKFTLSPTNENTVIEQFGEETEKWKGKTINVMIESCNVGRTGKQITVI